MKHNKRRFVRALLFASLPVLLAGCVLLGDKADQFRWHFGTLPFFVFDNAPGYKEPAQPGVMEDPVNVALAISGGGTRSAVFAAGAMEQLAYMSDGSGRNILDRCEAVSAVSAGSIAAGYYALYKPAHYGCPEDKAAFFQRFKSHMTVDFLMRGWVHYLSHPWEAGMKYYTRYRFAQSLANTFDQHMFLGATFGDIARREASGEVPTTIINATALDSGHRFLFSNLNVSRNFGFKASEIDGSAALGVMAKALSAPAYATVGFDGIDSDICNFRLASAISASSAYPVLPGPTSLRNYATGGYVHLADGGVSDNFGVDSLAQLYLNRVARGKAGRLVVICLDATAPLEPSRPFDPNGYSSSLKYGEQASTIMGARGQTFANVLYNAAGPIKVIQLRLWDSPHAKELRSRKTTLQISEKDMHVVLCAAADVAQAKKAEILSAVGGK